MLRSSGLSDSCHPPTHPRGSSVHGIFKARVLEWVAISFFRGSSQPSHWIHLSSISYNEGKFYICWAIKEANNTRSQQRDPEWKSPNNPFLLSILWLLFIFDLAFSSNLGFWSFFVFEPSLGLSIHLFIDASTWSFIHHSGLTHYLSALWWASLSAQMMVLSSATPCGLFLHHACRECRALGATRTGPSWVAWVHCKPGDQSAVSVRHHQQGSEPTGLVREEGRFPGRETIVLPGSSSSGGVGTLMSLASSPCALLWWPDHKVFGSLCVQSKNLWGSWWNPFFFFFKAVIQISLPSEWNMVWNSQQKQCFLFSS